MTESYVVISKETNSTIRFQQGFSNKLLDFFVKELKSKQRTKAVQSLFTYGTRSLGGSVVGAIHLAQCCILITRILYNTALS